MPDKKNNGSACKPPGFRHVLEAALFFGAIGGLADASYIFTRNPDLIAHFTGGLRFLTASFVLNTLALFLYMVVVFAILRPIALLRKWPLELSLAILYMMAALPGGAIITRNLASMLARESLLVAQVKTLFYFLKYSWVLLPVCWAIGVWLARVRVGTSVNVLFGRLTGVALSATAFMLATPWLQQRYLLSRANRLAEVSSGLENVLITVGLFVLAVALLPVFIRIAIRLARLRGGSVLTILWLVVLIVPYVPPMVFAPPVHGTPPSGASLSGRPSNVILVSMDTTRYDDVGFNGSPIVKTPTLDALAGEGVVFDNAITPMPITGPAHLSMLTGLQPDPNVGHGVKSNGIPLPKDVPTLATLLDAAGYRTGAVIGGFPLSRQASGIERGFHYFNDVFDEGLRARFLPDQVWYLTPMKIVKKAFRIKEGLPHGARKSADVVTDQALDWLEKNADKPFFLFVHYFDPHYLYAPKKPFDTMYMPGYDGLYRDKALAYVDLVKEIGSFTEEDFAYYRALYRGDISFVDNEFKRIVDWGDQNNLWENTLLIIVSDHGEGFEHDYYFNHTDRVYDQLIHVPMVIVDPEAGAKGQRVATPVNVSDIYFTVLDFLKVQSPRTVEAMHEGVFGVKSGWDHNLIGLIPGANSGTSEGQGGGWEFVPSQSYSFSAPGELSLGRFFSFRFQDWALIYGPDAQPSLPEYQYFDLIMDPEEMNDIYPGIVRSERKTPDVPEALKLWASMQGSADVSALSPEAYAQLKALGYVQEGGGAQSGAD